MKIEHPSILEPPELQLEREGEIVVECALAFGKDTSWLYGSAGESNISCWNGVGVENGRITRIDWYDEKLTGRIPEAIGELTALTYLFLGENDLEGEIPSSLGRLKKLRQLNLARNMLTGSIPRSFSNLTSLDELGLYNNYLHPDAPWYLAGAELKEYLWSLEWRRVPKRKTTSDLCHA